MENLLSRFQAVRLLKSDPQTKTVAVLGTIDGQDAIVSLEKLAFAFDEFKFDQVVESLKTINTNDIYYWSQANLVQNLEEVPGAKVNLIFPATETHIRKYSTQKLHYIVETAETYNSKVKPFIETQKGDRIKWVHNILFHGKEAETFIHHDKDLKSGFVLLPDMKWDRISMESLYLVAIVNRTDIASVRDLNGEHLNFLLGLQNQIRAISSAKFRVNPDQLRIFIHYQPSYYHFHVHVVNVAHPGLADGINVGKAILLDDVIENMRLVPDYYQKRTLYYTLGENHALWKSLNN